VLLVALAVVAIMGLNAPLQQAMTRTIASDPRNGGVEVSVHYRNYVERSTLVYDVRSVDGDKSMADVFRVLLQFAREVKDQHFDTVLLAAKGTPKFQLEGSYFATLGNEYGEQNPIYTMRTFPENARNLDGQPAFPTWEGGLLGVSGKQMEDLTELHKRWWLNDLGGKE